MPKRPASRSPSPTLPARSPLEWRCKRQRDESPGLGRWMIHPFFPLVRHENQLRCPACNDYAIHFAYGAAASTSSFMTAVGSLADRAARFSGRESSSDLHAQVDRLRHQRDKLVQDLAAAREELARLSRGSDVLQPAGTHDVARELEWARKAYVNTELVR